MAGGKKARSKSGKYYDSPALNVTGNYRSTYCSDKRLLPRMKEYMKQLDDTADIDLDDMVSSLQSTYPEYSRRKRQAFRSLVAKLYQSFDKSVQFPGQDSEQWLEQRERDHFEKRMREAKEEEEEENDLDDGGSPVLSCSDEEKDEDEILGMEVAISPEDLSVMDTPPVAAILNSLSSSSSSSSSSCGDSSCSVQPSSTPPRDAIVDSTRLTWQTLTTPIAEPTTTTTTDNEATPTSLPSCNEATPTSLPSALKRVTFSTPEVTAKVPYVVDSESGMERKARKLKKRHRHHSGDLQEEEVDERREGVKPKRRKTKEGGEKEDGPRQSGNAEFVVQTSSVRFSDVGGCDAAIKEISKLLLHLLHPELFSWLGVSPPQGFLLHGPPGCGKTLLAHAIAGELNLPFIKLAATEVVSGVSGESEGTIRDLFTLAKSHAPCVLFVDEVDAICRKREAAQREMERRIVTQLLACLDDLNNSDSHSRVLVVGATSSPDSLDPGLRRAGRFDREISLGIPDQQARESILKVLGRGLRLESNLSFGSISRETPGFVGADLMALVREASLCAVNRILSNFSSFGCKNQELLSAEHEESDAKGPLRGMEGVSVAGGRVCCPRIPEDQLSSAVITEEDFKEALTVVQPSAKREGFATVPDVTWNDVGALEAVREELSYAILAPVRYPTQFAKLGLTSPRGVLLSGPPGCGKTLLAKAIANESGINFISVKGPELLNMYVGESERAVRQVFQRARNSAPCVIFFDELDALCPKRSEMAESSASSRVVNQLLTEMDGLVARRQVFIMGATNRPDIIDPAVLRPGRLDKVLYVGLPTARDREAILKTITKAGTRPKLDGDVDLSVLASDEHSRGYSGADLTALVREAAIAALRDYMQIQPLLGLGASWTTNQLEESPDAECAVGMKHFLLALNKVRPSVSEKDRLYYEQMAKNCTLSNESNN